jgi:NADPH:quinone reductase-like Zn-dependent oxidoreductase
MKAVYFEQHGELDALRYGDVPEPAPRAGEALIRVRACGLNYLDVWVRRGWPGLKLPMPHWCGADVAGEVAALGAGVSGWRIGQRVVVDPGINLKSDEYTRRGEPSISPAYHILGEHVRGGAAEWVAVPAENLVAMPAGLDFPAAAAPLLVGLTAWRMLVHRAGLNAGETVLVVGAGGGVNSMAIQVAKLAGATVLAVASSADKAEKARALGADQVIDRSGSDWVKEVLRLTDRRGADVVVDNVGRATLTSSMQAVARGGRIVIVGNTSGPKAEIDIRYIFAKQISLIGSTMGSHQDFLTLVELIGAGRLKPMVDRVVPLQDGVDAYRLLEQGGHFGKIILQPAS